MGVDLLGVLLLVQVLELGLDVGLRLLVLVGAWRVWEGRRSESDRLSDCTLRTLKRITT